MMNPQIKNRYTGSVIYEGEAGMTTRQMLEKATTAKADLYGADLRSANLRGANLYGADLGSANLGSANLYGANLGGADLYGANLGSADLRSANLYGANLYGANLGSADLRSADLRSADLGSANLGSANLGSANLGSANLYGANLGEKLGKMIEGRPCFQCGPIGSRADYLLSFLTDKGIIIRAGCFMGTLDEFRDKVASTHGDNDHAKEYEMAMLMVETHAAIWMPKGAA